MLFMRLKHFWSSQEFRLHYLIYIARQYSISFMSVTDSAKEKLLIIDWVLRQEKSQNLKAMSEMIAQIDRDSADSVKVIGYRAKGLSVTFSQLVSSIKDSIQEIEENKVISLDDLEHESDQW